MFTIYDVKKFIFYLFLLSFGYTQFGLPFGSQLQNQKLWIHQKLINF